MEKNKYLIAINTTNIGGVEKSLLNFIDTIYEESDITLVVSQSNGKLLDYLPEKIKIVPLFSTSKLNNLIYKILTLFFPQVMRFILHKKIKGQNFDYVIAYIEFFPTVILKKIKANKKKVAFIHTDLRAFYKYKYLLYNAWNAYKEYDVINCVSKSTKESLEGLGKEFKAKINIIPNVQNVKKVVEKSKESGVDMDASKKNFVCITRLAPPKAPERLLELAKIFRSENVMFHVIGGGKQLHELQAQANNEKIENVIKFYGHQDNPYKFLRQADVLLCVSEYEGFGMVFEEAKILKKIIITTDVADVKKTVQGKFGFVCDNNLTNLANTIKKYINGEYDNEIERIEAEYRMYDAEENNDITIKKLRSMLEVEI